MAARQIKTAEQHVADMDLAERQRRAREQTRKREQAEFKRKQRELEDVRDMRDDLMSMVRNSGMSYEDIHARCGPHPSTLKSWDLKLVDRPQMGKMRSVGRIIGKRLVWVDDVAEAAND